MNAREAILKSIRSANPSATTPGQRSADRAQIPRGYVRDGKLSAVELLNLFEHRLVEYDAHLVRTDAAGIAETVHRFLATRSVTRMLIPAGLNKDWLPIGPAYQEDDALSYDALDRYDGVITAASAAIALTGSIVLQHGPGQGRRALTLIPDYHLCIVFAGQVVETVPQAFARLDPVHPTTFISGPSATADIEMTRIKGVHGPRFLDVVLVG